VKVTSFQILAFAAFIWSQAASAAVIRPLYWNELEEGRAYSLRQEVKLSDKVKFPANTRLELTAREALSGPGLSLVYFGLREAPCANPQWQEGLELVLPEGELDSSRSVGVELGKNCQWGIYVETKDLEASAIFNPL
jgi:hypothetical protein